MRYKVRLQVEGIETAGEGAAAHEEGITSVVSPGLVRAQGARRKLLVVESNQIPFFRVRVPQTFYFYLKKKQKKKDRKKLPSPQFLSFFLPAVAVSWPGQDLPHC